MPASVYFDHLKPARSVAWAGRDPGVAHVVFGGGELTVGQLESGGTVYLGSLYLQQVLGDSPQRVGIATLPVPLGVAVGAYTVTRLLGHGRDSRYSGAALVVVGFGLAVSQVPLAALATSNTSEQVRGAVAGVYSMGQQVGTAIGLAAFSMLAVASADGSAPAERLHGLQVATLGTSALALAAAMLAGLTLPRSGELRGLSCVAGRARARR